MRILLTLNVVLFCLTFALGQEVASVLLISKIDKSYVGYLLKEEPKIIFDVQSFDVQYNGTVDCYSFSDIEAISYVSENDVANLILCGTTKENASVKISQGCLSIIIPKDSEVQIFDASGKLLYSKKIKANTVETIDLSELSSGINILSIDSLIYKFAI